MCFNTQNTQSAAQSNEEEVKWSDYFVCSGQNVPFSLNGSVRVMSDSFRVLLLNMA